MKCTLIKKSATMKAATKAKKGNKGDAPVEFEIQDNGDATFTVFGKNGAGALLDITDVATLTVSSDSPNLTVDTPVGMTSAMHGVTAGSASITAVATWNDGSVGPFTFTLPVTLKMGPANAIEIIPGTPTVRP